MLSLWHGNELDKLNIQDIKRFKLSAEYGPAFEAKPLVQHGSVDSAEVGVELWGAIIKIGETGAWAYETTFYLAAGQEDRGSGAVPGAAAAIFLDCSAEFRKRHQQDPVKQLVTL